MSFWGELKRRNVFKVGAVYVIVGWVILQAISIIFPLLNLPTWTGTFVTVLLIIGFPVALIFAWAFELTSDGVKRTSEVSHDESITHMTGRKLNYVFGGLFVVAVALLIFDNYYLDRRVVETETATTKADQIPVPVEKEEAPKTIAVLPFADMSPDKDQEYFVDGLSEEILNSLTKIQDLRVIARTSSFSFKGTDKKIQEIADELGANHILEGSVRKAGDALRITAQLIRAADGIHLWSETYDRKLEDIFAVQEDIATSVANELKVALGIGTSFKQLGGTDNLKAYELYLVAQGQWITDEYELALKTINEAIEIDPEFAIAWTLKAGIHIHLAIFGSSDHAASEQDSVFKAAQRAIELEPKLGQGYSMLGTAHMTKGEFIKAEVAYRKGMELRGESIDLFLPRFYTMVGHLEKFRKVIDDDRRIDPLNVDIWQYHIESLGFSGDVQRMEDEAERFRNFVGNTSNLYFFWVTCSRLWADDIASRDSIEYSDPVFDTAKEFLDSPSEALEALHRIFTENLSGAQFMYLSVWAAYFGDPEFAMEAVEKGVGIESGGFFMVWSPVMHEVRQLPRFKELVREIGLVDYWEQFGWPDLCHPTDDGDFVCN